MSIAIPKEEKTHLTEETLKLNIFVMVVMVGCQFVAFNLMIQYQCHISHIQAYLDQDNLSICYVISVEIENMFNNMSCKQYRKIIWHKFLHLLTTFDALYKTNNKVFIRKENEDVEVINQK
eukprot:9507366-Ditylum_brightwellii.AAC.1